MTPSSYLAAARSLLEKPPASVGERWPRSCACLTRIALERGVEEYWRATEPSLSGATMRSQLIALPTYAGAQLAREVAAAWNGLSRAMHHHAYELPPTVDELRGWQDSVQGLLAPLSHP